MIPKRLILVCALLTLAAKPHAKPFPYFTATPLVDCPATGPCYLGQFAGRLYDGSNDPPADYAAYGQTIAQGITPLDAAGNPSPTGQIVLLSVGMSNTSAEWCGTRGDAVNDLPCAVGVNQSFMQQAGTDAAANHSSLVVLNGALGHQDARDWTCAYGTTCIKNQPGLNNYDRVRDTVLSPAGVTEAQVQAVWMKHADAANAYFLPDSRASAYLLEQEMGDALRAMQTRWPNLRVIIASSRIYAGYAGTATVQGGAYTVPIEPFAYETGFSVKWLIAAKVNQWRTGTIDPVAGDLSTTPFLGWGVGTYLWGSGTQNPSGSLALSWATGDFASDFIHPSNSGIAKVSTRLLSYFKTSPFAASWFLAH